MKRGMILVLLCFYFCSCAPKQDKVEKTTENGVEIVVSHLEPYKIRGEPTNLTLEKELSIDLAREDIAKLGLADIYSFGVDSEGNIYILNGKQVEYFIFKFDKNGRFVKFFGRKGQGPGELEWTLSVGFDSQSNVIVSDPGNRKLAIFSPRGDLIRETQFPKTVYSLYPLDNKEFIAYWRKWTSPTDDYFYDHFSLYDSELQEIRLLDACRWPNPRKFGIRGPRLNRVFNWKKSGDRIYIGNEDRGYEILVFDWDGNVLRKIRKDHEPVKVQISEEDKKKIIDERRGLKVLFPKFWTPFGSFFADEEGRLYVQTYEMGEVPNEYIYDIFNRDGIFISRKSLPIRPAVDIEGDAVAKKGRLYCVIEKETGYKALVVYRMIWKK